MTKKEEFADGQAVKNNNWELNLAKFPKPK